MKTNELIGPALDWVVAKCEYDELAAKNIQYPQSARYYPTISPSTNWAQGGPIIEREFICLSAPAYPSTAPWQAVADSAKCKAIGPTPLIAAMRCYVASVLGDEVDVPDELKG